MNQHKDTIVFEISICPTELEVGSGGDIIDKDLLLERIKEVAHEVWGADNVRFDTLQIGYEQGDSWARSWVNGKRNDGPAETLLYEHIDWTDEDLYESEPSVSLELEI